MEQMPVTVIRKDLPSRSQKALTFGILSAAIPTAVAVIGDIIFVILFLVLGIGAANRNDTASAAVAVFASFGELLQSLLIAGILETVLGKIAWNQARTIRRDAADAGVRRPAGSVVAHVFGISSFASGIVLTVISSLYLLILLTAAIVTGFIYCS